MTALTAAAHSESDSSCVEALCVDGHGSCSESCSESGSDGGSQGGNSCGRVLCVVASAFAVKMLVVGMYLSYGPLFYALRKNLGAAYSEAAVVGALTEAACNVSCLFVGSFLERHGNVMCVAIGATCFCVGLIGDALAGSYTSWFFTHPLVGIGMGFLDIAVMRMLQRHTPRRWRGLCIGLSSGGAGVGMAVISSLINLGIGSLGLSPTLVCFATASAVIFSAVLVATKFLERAEPHGFGSSVGGESSDCVSLHWMLDRRFCCFFLGLGLYAVGYTVPYNFLEVIAKNRGVLDEQFTAIPIVMGVSDVIGMITLTALSDYCQRHVAMFACMVLCSSLSLAALPLCTSFFDLILFGIIYGVVSGGRAGLLFLVCMEVFGEGPAISAYGAACTMFLCTSFGSPFVGVVKDVVGSVHYGFFAVAAVTFVSFLCLLPFTSKYSVSKVHAKATVDMAKPAAQHSPGHHRVVRGTRSASGIGKSKQGKGQGRDTGKGEGRSAPSTAAGK